MKTVDELVATFKTDDALRVMYISRAVEPYLKRKGDYYNVHEGKMIEMFMRINEALMGIDYEKHRPKLTNQQNKE